MKYQYRFYLEGGIYLLHNISSLVNQSIEYQSINTCNISLSQIHLKKEFKLIAYFYIHLQTEIHQSKKKIYSRPDNLYINLISDLKQFLI
jgi:hypothetical protein